MKTMYVTLALVLVAAVGCVAQEKPQEKAQQMMQEGTQVVAQEKAPVAAQENMQEKGLLIDDFEYQISGGPDGTVDFGTGGDSKVEVTASSEVKHTGNQSLKVTYDAKADGYMWMARGFELDAKNTAWGVSLADIDWSKYDAIAFFMYGSNSGTNFAIDLKDNGKEMWRYIFSDDFQGWQQIVCPFSDFMARRDWQPESADKNDTLDFPIKSYQFEPKAEAQGIVYFDTVEFIKQ